MAGAAAASGGAPGAHQPVQPVRDFFGFSVKHEEIYLRFAPIYKEEEEERCCRWDQYMQELNEVVPRCAAVGGRANAAPITQPHDPDLTAPASQPRCWPERLAS